VAGGCAFSLVVAIALGAFAAVTYYQRLQHGGFNCLPSDFPTYPGSTYGGFSYELNGSTPGNSCQMVFESSHGPDAVYTFYTGKLTSGDWQVVSSDPAIRHIAFRSKKRAKTSGTIDVGVRDDHAEYTVQLYS
jgi:hypothetical protein